MDRIAERYLIAIIYVPLVLASLLYFFTGKDWILQIACTPGIIVFFDALIKIIREQMEIIISMMGVEDE